MKWPTSSVSLKKLMADIFQKVAGVHLAHPVPRLSYDEVMLKYGSDKPDLRYGLEIVDFGDLALKSDFKVFKDVLAAGGVVRGLNAKKAADKLSNTDLKQGGKLSEFVSRYGAKGLAWMKVEADKFSGSIEKFFNTETQAALRQRFASGSGGRPAIRRRSTSRGLRCARRAAPTLGGSTQTLHELVGTGRRCKADGGRFQDRLGRRFSILYVRRGGKTLGRQPSSVYSAARRAFGTARKRSRQRESQSLRSSDERLRGRRRQYSNSRSRSAITRL